MSGPGPAEAAIRVLEVADEREPLAEAALALIGEVFRPPERQPLAELRSEVEEKRRGLLQPFDFHLLAAVAPEGGVVGVISGVYLAGVNAGFVTYLAVHAAARGRGVGRRARRALVEALRADARRAGQAELAWVLGEVRSDSAWIRRLVRTRGAIPFDLTYYHPGMRLDPAAPGYVLYREPIGDARRELPAAEVGRVLYAVWRRGYRVRYPLERETFRAMLAELEGRATIGAHPLAGS